MRSFVLIVPFIVMLGACASPDVGAFRQSTLALTIGLKENQTALVADAVSISDKMGNPPNPKSNIRTLESHEAAINEATAALTGYATAVSSLVNSGEEGADAAQTMLDSIASTVGSVSGQTIKLPEILTPLTEALGRIVQQDQNKKLYTIMAAVKGEVNAFAAHLSTVENGEASIVNALANFWKNTREDLNNYHQTYDTLTAKVQPIQTNASRYILSAVGRCPENAACDYTAISQGHTATQAAAVDEITELQALIAEIQPYEDAYQAFTKEIATWQGQARARIASVPAMAQAWQHDHDAIIDYLEECTKISGALKSKCGAFSAGNLELFGVLLGKAAFPF